MRISLMKIVRWAVFGAVSMAALTIAPTVSAHGEKSQQAFLRMRTIHWANLIWHKDTVPVNETMELTGLMHVFSGWPETVNIPSTCFLNIGIPGPVFVRQASWIGDQFVSRSVSLELGKTYDFKILMKARRPGSWHVHPMINVEGGGPVIGPGKWVDITGKMADYKFELTTLTGTTVDVERLGEGNIWFWHVFWYLIGCAWIVYWGVLKPAFLPRWMAVKAGKAGELITPVDKYVGYAFAAAAVLITAVSYGSANGKYPITIPLQAGVIGVMTPTELPAGVTAKSSRATYRVPGRSIKLTISVTNNSDAPVQMAEFETGSVRFLNAEVYQDEHGYPPALLAEAGLEVDDNSPIAPGETRDVSFTATDAAWETERLADVIYDPDSRYGALVFFIDDAGNKYIVEVGGPMIPQFI